MAELSQAEEIKVAVGVWICFVDDVVQPMETSKIYEVLKKDLVPETHVAAIDAVGKWLKEFQHNFLAAEKKLEDLVKSYDRLPIVQHQIIELAEHVLAADGKTHFKEEAAIKKLQAWIDSQI